MESVIIGVDHGYAAMKTARFVFPTGLAAHDYAPYVSKDVLQYGGKYYVVGSGRQPIQKDKTRTGDYYLLTLAAVARELSARNADPCANVHLAAGLPLSDFGRERDRFRDYLLRNSQPVSFRYENRDYRVAVTEVTLFPQGYAAALTRKEFSEWRSLNVIDIGGWTCDLIQVHNRLPDAAANRSLEKGVIRCVDAVAEKIRSNFGLSAPAAQIQSAMRGFDSGMGEAVENLVRQETKEYVRNLLSSVSESGMDLRVTPTMFVGGGASLVRRYADNLESFRSPLILEDVCLNAKAYESLAGSV